MIPINLLDTLFALFPALIPISILFLPRLDVRQCIPEVLFRLSFGSPTRGRSLAHLDYHIWCIDAVNQSRCADTVGMHLARVHRVDVTRDELH